MSRTLLGEKKYAKQTGGRGQYGHVRLRVILDDGVQGVVFTNALGDAIPARFLAAIESGILTSIKAGALQQCGYSDARIELYDGSWHDVDSTDLAFFIAGAGHCRTRCSSCHAAGRSPRIATTAPPESRYRECRGRRRPTMRHRWRNLMTSNQ